MVSSTLGVICAAISLVIAARSMHMVLRAHDDWTRRFPRTPAIVRWLWGATVACCAFTALMLTVMAIYHLASRHVDAASESFLSARMSFYTASVGYGIAWLRGRAKVNWPTFRAPSPRLLPPASTPVAEEPQEPEHGPHGG